MNNGCKPAQPKVSANNIHSRAKLQEAGAIFHWNG